MEHPGRVLHVADIIAHQRGYFSILDLAPNFKSTTMDQASHGAPGHDLEAVDAVLVDRSRDLSIGH